MDKQLFIVRWIMRALQFIRGKDTEEAKALLREAEEEARRILDTVSEEDR